jgi:hypothetical protein
MGIVPREVTEQRILPFGVDRMLLGGSKTTATPEAETVGASPLDISLQTREIMFLVPADFGLCDVSSGRVTQVPLEQFAIDETLSFPR